MTTIVIPYTKFNPAQAQHLRMEGYEPVYEYVGDSPYRYFEIFRDYWRRGEDFILLEHDIIPWPGALATFESCPDIWCAFGYLYPPDGYLVVAHGCVRFRAKMMESVPDLLDIVEANDGRFFKVKETDTRHWKDLDGCISPILTGTLERFPHRHVPAVVHTKLLEDKKGVRDILSRMWGG